MQAPQNPSPRLAPGAGDGDAAWLQWLSSAWGSTTLDAAGRLRLYSLTPNCSEASPLKDDQLSPAHTSEAEDTIGRRVGRIIPWAAHGCSMPSTRWEDEPLWVELDDGTNVKYI